MRISWIKRYPNFNPGAESTVRNVTSVLQNWTQTGRRRTFCYCSLFKFLGALATLRKATISFFVPVHPHETVQLPQEGFS
jgi:hypothetical protein